MGNAQGTGPAERTVHRICVFAGHYAPHMGGVENFTASLWGRLVHRGHAVLVITSNTHGVAAREVIDGIEVLRLPVVKLLGGRFPVPLPFPALFDSLRLLKRWNPTIIVTNTRFFPTSIMGALVARRRRLPHLHIEHGSAHIDLGNALLNPVGELWDHGAGRFVVRSAARCVGVSLSTGDFVKHLAPVGCGVLYNGVDANVFSPGPSSCRERLGLPPETYLFAFAGRFIEQKGASVLLEAFRSFPERTDAALALAGTGSLERLLKERASSNPNVFFLGRLDRGGMVDLLRGADCFVLPTSYPEGLPSAVLEAQAVGLPVITTPVGGNTEIVVHGRNGLVVPPDDVPALAEAMLEMMRNPVRSREMGATAREHIEKTFDWDRVADRALEEIDLCMREYGGG